MLRKTALVFVASLLTIPAAPSKAFAQLSPTAEWATHAQNQYQVSAEDLPLCCPMPQMYLWNSHPRVYLAVEETGWAKCPYCGAEYTLRR